MLWHAVDMAENPNDAPWPTSDRINPPDLGHALPTLTGTRWALTEYHDVDGPHAIPEGVVSTLTLEGAELNVAAGCNQGRASVTLHAESLEVGPLALTRMMCEPPAMAVEAAVTSVLEGRVPYVLSGEVLTLRGSGSTLVYRPAGDA